MLASTLLIGMMKSSENSFIILAIIPTNTVRAAFSKSVSWISIGRNSTRHPISESHEGGGLNLIVFQLVDWMFSKWETSVESVDFVNQSQRTF